MIYLVTTENSLFKSPNYKVITVQESLDIMDSWDAIQFDTETSGDNFAPIFRNGNSEVGELLEW